MEKQETLQWFVDFANMDLETIKPGDKAKLLVESEEYLSPKGDIDELNKPIPVSKKELGPMAWALEIPDKESEMYWPMILRLQRIVQKHLLSFMPSAGYIESKGYQMIAVRISWGKKLPFAITYRPITETQDEYVRFKIFRLLEGFSGHALRRCPGCERFFFNPTRKEKKFCSPKCMWKVIAGKRRKELKEKHPGKYKAYLKKQRETMRQKYEKTLKAKGYKKVSHYKKKKD